MATKAADQIKLVAVKVTKSTCGEYHNLTAKLEINGDLGGMVLSDTASHSVIIEDPTISATKVHKAFGSYFKDAAEAKRTLGGSIDFYEQAFHGGTPADLFSRYLDFLVYKAQQRARKKSWPIVFSPATKADIKKMKDIRDELAMLADLEAPAKSKPAKADKKPSKPAKSNTVSLKDFIKSLIGKRGPNQIKVAAMVEFPDEDETEVMALVDKMTEGKKSKPAKKPAKPAKKTTGKRQSGVGDFIKEKLVEGKMSQQEILDAVLVKFPEANTTKANVAWYAWKIKKASK